MKALFLIFHDFKEFNGITKKIRYQVNALQKCGVDVRTCYLKEDKLKFRMVDDRIIKEYGEGFLSKILKRIEFNSIIEYVRKENIQLVYIRHDHNSNPFTIRLVRKIKELGCKTVLEIPTYPYDKEYKHLPLAYQRILLVDVLFRKRLAKYIDYIITFSDHDVIWNRPTIQISNGIDFDSIKEKEKTNDTKNELKLLGLATIHPWHGFDRILKGLAHYYKSNPAYRVTFHIVGFGVTETMNENKEIISENNLEPYVFLYGGLFGTELDSMFSLCDLGIGSLARHRSGIDRIKTLKNREYAARGIPFIYSETDEDFDTMPYVLKIPANDSVIDIDQLISFYHSEQWSPQAIRKSIENKLSWEKQMDIILHTIYK